MPVIDFDEIALVGDDIDDVQIIKNIIETEKIDFPIHVLDVGDIIKKHKLWLEKFPRIVPHFGGYFTMYFIIVCLLHIICLLLLTMFKLMLYYIHRKYALLFI